MSHMSCKAPQKAAHRLPWDGPRGTHGPCQTETPPPPGPDREAASGPREPPNRPSAAHLGALLQAAAQLLQALSETLTTTGRLSIKGKDPKFLQ